MAAGAEKVDLELREFDPATIQRDSTMLLIGRRGTGKSFLLRYILYKLQKQGPKTDMVVAFAGTRDAAVDLMDMIPQTCIHADYNERLIEKIIQDQERFKDEGEYVPNVLIVMDDCGFDRAALKSKVMANLFKNGRHYNIFFIVLLQYAIDMPPDLRSNVTYVCAAYDGTYETRVKLWKNFFGMFQKMDAFEAVFTALRSKTQRGFLVQDNSGGNKDITDAVFFIEAKATRKFCFGSRDLWKCDARARQGTLPAPPRALQNVSKIKSVQLKRAADDDEEAGPSKRRRH